MCFLGVFLCAKAQQGSGNSLIGGISKGWQRSNGSSLKFLRLATVCSQCTHWWMKMCTSNVGNLANYDCFLTNIGGVPSLTHSWTLPPVVARASGHAIVSNKSGFKTKVYFVSILACLPESTHPILQGCAPFPSTVNLSFLFCDGSSNRPSI